MRHVFQVSFIVKNECHIAQDQYSCTSDASPGQSFEYSTCARPGDDTHWRQCKEHARTTPLVNTNRVTLT
jgi:hypothetical protein